MFVVKLLAESGWIYTYDMEIEDEKKALENAKAIHRGRIEREELNVSEGLYGVFEVVYEASE